MEKNSNNIKVCVTGGAGFIGSWLVEKLLDKGYTVHATLRNLGDSSKVGLLKSLPNAEVRLRLFEADIYDPDAFEFAIEGCEYVFHVATPMQHYQTSEFKDLTEAAIAGAKSIMNSCIKSKTVKRLIYTASVMSASPLKEDGTGFKDYIDESCWTPLNLSFAYATDFTKDYTISKTLIEKEVLKYNDMEKYGLDVVTLVCGLVIGGTLLPYITGSQGTILSLLPPYSTLHFSSLRVLQEMLGSIPLVHIDDVCEAHVFCMENPLINGRFLCAKAYPTVMQIVNYFLQNYPELTVKEEIMEGQEKAVECGSTKLIDMGFEYKYDMKEMLDDNVDCAKKLGVLQ